MRAEESLLFGCVFVHRKDLSISTCSEVGPAEGGEREGVVCTGGSPWGWEGVSGRREACREEGGRQQGRCHLPEGDRVEGV